MPEAAIIEERVQFPSEGLKLEGVLAYLEQRYTVTDAVLLLSPHPHFGGNMDNNVIRHLARRAAQDGSVTLRFNYRGVGGSEIRLPMGESPYAYWESLERERRYAELLPDVINASRLLRQASSCRRWMAAGYSLGALLAGMLYSEAAPDLVLAISPPDRKVKLNYYGKCKAHKVFICGDADFAHDPVAFKEAYKRIPGPKALLDLAGTDHFFRGQEERLYQASREFLCGLKQ